MKTKSLILILIALGCGLVASIGISQVMESRKEGGTGVEMAPILVALTDMDIGSKLDAKSVKLEEWPKSKIPEGALQSLDKLEDRFARARLYKGEAILEFKLMGPNEGVDTAIKIPRGMRALPVRLDLDTVIGLIQPGDKVDVMVFVRKTNEIKQTAMVTILTDVTVFAVGKDVERATDKDGKQIEAKTVSLLVKQDQAETLAMATELGKIRLTLRRPDEQGDAGNSSETTIDKMLGGTSEASATTHDAPKAPTPSDIIAALGGKTPDPDPTLAPKTDASAGGPRIKMQILTPTDSKEFEWSDRNNMPVEVAKPGLVTGASGGSFAGAPPIGTPPSTPIPPVKTDDELDN